MSEKNFPNWMLFAVVFGLGELTYWFWKRFGMGAGTKIFGAVAVVAAVFFVVIYVKRMINRKQSGKKF